MVKPDDNSDATVQLREFLNWERDINSKKYRIVHSSHHMKWEEPAGFILRTESRPLIECSLGIRFRMYDKLHILVDELRKKIES